MQETTTKKKAAPRASKMTQAAQSPDVGELVQVRAYFLAEQSGFDSGRDMEFWLQAESETLATLAPAKPARKPRVKKEAAAA